MKKAILGCCLFLAALTTFSQKKPAPDKRLATLDTALSRLVSDWKMAGFAVAVVEKNKIVYAKGFGYRDVANKKPVTENTLFAIGSCTKAFTSSLLGMLEKDGQVSLDKTVREYLPGVHFYNDNMDNIITVRDMMTHRTGLPRHDFSWYLFRSKSRDSLMKRIQYQEPSAGIRERWQYNNFMFLLQGMIAEKLTNKSWEDNIRDRILKPLGMTRSNLSIQDLEKDGDAALGYDVKSDSIVRRVDYYNIDAMGPAGSINSSVTEMANWVITWINGGKFGSTDIIPAAYLRQAMGSQMVISDGLPDKENPDINFSNYGLGWFLNSYRGHFRVEHGGNIDGFSASTSFFPSDSIGIIVLTNQNASAVPPIARNIIADRMLKLKPVDWNGSRLAAVKKAKTQTGSESNVKSSSQVKGTRPSHKLEEYAGLYSHPGYGVIELFTRNDSLLGRTPGDSVWLRHFHYDVFEVKGYDKVDGVDTSMGGTKANFRSDEMGKISGLAIALEGALSKPLEFTFKPKEKSITKEELEKYVGEFVIGEMVAKVYIKNDVLFLFVPGQPEYETASIGNHTFNLKALQGFSIRFTLDDKNEVTGADFIQPNGTFKAVKKK